jgi:hypothetical protein
VGEHGVARLTPGTAKIDDHLQGQEKFEAGARLRREGGNPRILL